MPKFKKKPVEIEAHHFTGWDGLDPLFETDPSGWLLDAMKDGRIIWGGQLGQSFVIDTLEGHMSASVGDWIIRGVKGEIYPCKPDIFAASYDPA